MSKQLLLKGEILEILFRQYEIIRAIGTAYIKW